MDTRDWIDGLFSNIFREMNRPTEREVNRNARQYKYTQSQRYANA